MKKEIPGTVCKECGRKSGFYGMIEEWLSIYEGVEWGYNWPKKMLLINKHFREVLDKLTPTKN